MHLSFGKHVPSQVLKDLSVENSKDTPITFFLKFSSETYLTRIINYWDNNFTLYQREERSHDSREGRENHYFCFPLSLPPCFALPQGLTTKQGRLVTYDEKNPPM